jgi:hypothetical protein
LGHGWKAGQHQKWHEPEPELCHLKLFPSHMTGAWLQTGGPILKTIKLKCDLSTWRTMLSKETGSSNAVIA